MNNLKKWGDGLLMMLATVSIIAVIMKNGALILLAILMAALFLPHFEGVLFHIFYVCVVVATPFLLIWLHNRKSYTAHWLSLSWQTLLFLTYAPPLILLIVSSQVDVGSFLSTGSYKLKPVFWASLSFAAWAMSAILGFVISLSFREIISFRRAALLMLSFALSWFLLFQFAGDTMLWLLD